jgi:pimeloyl-ACP methyl ester carboxylesterase
MRALPLLFQCLFYTGSWVSEKQYEPVLEKVRDHPLVERVRFSRWWEEPDRDRNDTVLIGHSLGGYFALRDAMRFPERVAGVVLWNSHFNSQGRMPYLRIPVDKVPTHVLTVLGGRDDRLPVRKAMDDAWECSQERVMDKYFVVNRDHGHFTGITEEEGWEQVVGPTHEFLWALATRNFSEVRARETTRRRFFPENYYLSDTAVVASRPANILDALLKIVVPQSVWRFSHFLWFLTSKPDRFLGYLFVDENHIYLKGSPYDEGVYQDLLREWVQDLPTRVRDYQLPALHPLILLWLFLPLRPTWDGKEFLAPRIVLRVDNQTTYYKVPNPRRFFALLPDDRFFG